MSETENEIRNTISAPVSDEDLEPLVLTDRDMSLFRYAHEHRYLAYSQIRAAFWKERSLDAKACYKRVERLVNAGYLKRVIPAGRCSMFTSQRRCHTRS